MHQDKVLLTIKAVTNYALSRSRVNKPDTTKKYFLLGEQQQYPIQKISNENQVRLNGEEVTG